MCWGWGGEVRGGGGRGCHCFKTSEMWTVLHWKSGSGGINQSWKTSEMWNFYIIRGGGGRGRGGGNVTVARRLEIDGRWGGGVGGTSKLLYV